MTEVRAPEGYLPGYSENLAIVGGPNEITVANLPPVTLTIHKIDENGEPLSDDQGGACFYLIENVCDGDDGANDGTIPLIAPPGTYTLYEQRAPEGYLIGQPQQITISASGPNEITIENVRPETVIIHKVDENGEPLTDSDSGACFQLGFDPAGSACDSSDGANDGIITLQTAPGVQTQTESVAPQGYFQAESKQVTITAGGSNEFTVSNVPYPTLTIHKVDENGDPATDADTGACFEDEYRDAYACDSDDGANDGAISLSVPPGWISLKEPHAPSGYGATIYSIDFFFTPDGQNEVTVPNVKLQQLTILTVDEHGNPITDEEMGACYGVPSWDGDEYYVWDRTCDSDDGANDGAVDFPGMYPGFLELAQVRSPSGYARAGLIHLRVKQGGPTEFTVVNNHLQPLTIHLVDEDGNPIIDEEWGLCLSLATGFDYEWEDWITPYWACDGDDGANDGTFVFPAVAPRSYWLVQSRTIEGFSVPEPYQITVVVGAPTEITAVNTSINEEPPATATVSPKEGSVVGSTDQPTSSDPRETGGVVELPNTGAGSNPESSSRVLLILAGVAIFGVLGTTIWLRRKIPRGS